MYVDDFKLAGPTAAIAEGWRKIARRIKISKPAIAGRYLGCQHHYTHNERGGSVEFEVTGCMKQVCTRYLEVTGLPRESLTPALTPFLPDSAITEEDEE